MRLLLLLFLAGPVAAQQMSDVTKDRPGTGQLTADDAVLPDDSHYDLWRYRGTAGERVRIELRSDAFDCYLSVGTWRDGNLAVRAANDDMEPGTTDARVDVTVPSDGELVIRANSYSADETGGYTITVTQAPPAPAVVVRTIAPGTTAGGSFAEDDPTRMGGAPAHYWSFEAEPGMRYAISLSSGEVDTFLEVGRGEGEAFEPVQENDDVETSTDSRILFDASEGGRWIIRASTYGAGEVGAYRIAIQRLGPAR